MSEYPVWPEAHLRELAAGLTPNMRHVLLRCSEYTDWSAKHERGIPREWIDLVAGRKHCTFRRSIGALVTRGLAVLVDGNRVAASHLGLAVRGRLIREGFRA